METTAAPAFPVVDTQSQESITDEQAQFFLDHGLLILPGLLKGEELRRLQAETLPLIERAARERVADPDYAYGKHEATGREVPRRIEYPIEKSAAGKALLGHPFVLRSVEKLQGRNFIPTWDAMVFKLQGAGAAVPWHRDAGKDHIGARPIFNVDFYLDEADLSTCLWGIPGSNHWTQEEAQAAITRLNQGGFQTEGAQPLPMRPGDALIHNILTLHGSPPSQARLRRVIYYEFRPAETELQLGPHTPEYIPIKQKVLLACLRDRAAAPYAAGERAFTYRPTAEFAPPPLAPEEKLSTYRYPHKQYWRTNEVEERRGGVP